jgi:hypothetical protein
MKQLGDIGNSPLALIGALFHPWVALGVALLIVWTCPHGAAELGRSQLCHARDRHRLCVTALSGKFFLGETVSPRAGRASC